MKHLPLEGLVVLEFCQYLSGPSAGLRLADLGARVIKIESPKGGDACRRLAIKNLWVEDNSLLFHTINRNKESFTANLKDEADLAVIKKLIFHADVLIHNFRPGVMEKLGLGYSELAEKFPRIIYAEISGYGESGPWAKNPGQDLLLQAKSGLMYHSGNVTDPPVPFGLAIGDILCGAQLVQGILAAAIRRQKTGKGGRIQLSLLESLLDFQFELLTTYLTSEKLPERAATHNGHPLLGSPYGIYQTSDGYIAIAMVDMGKLAEVLGEPGLRSFSKEELFSARNEIKKTIAECVKKRSSDEWVRAFEQLDLWVAKLLNWKELIATPAYQALDMEQVLQMGEKQLKTTRCPIRMNGEVLKNAKPAPALGEHTRSIISEFDLAPA